MFFDGVKKFLGLDQNANALKKYSGLVDIVNSYADDIHSKSDDEIKSRFNELKLNLPDDLSEILPEVFAIVREVSDRTINLRHYDVQLIGGMALHDGRIAEMKTGEGKTLVAPLAIILNSMRGEGVHLVTVNDYLAKRDAEWMSPVYNFLGMRAGVIYPYMPQNERISAYMADVTYGTNSEFGFDYLRDNMVMSVDEMVQRGHNFCIVDEVDSILIDEARTPLIISGPSDDDAGLYIKADSAARSLKLGSDYEIDEKEKSVSMTESGIQKCEDYLKMPGLFSDVVHSDLAHRIIQSIKAHELYKRDTDYVVKDGEVIIVDEFTGRLMVGRRYSDGLHQAIEAKERVKVGRESQTLATITLQNYFRMYHKLAGMTGTAATEAEEFREIYGLQVVTIPTHKPMIRTDNPDVIYATEHEKFNAVADEVQERHKNGQPVLVGTTSIENSERVSKLLKARKIPHNVLNAKFHEKEAEIVAQAGREGAVTVATNMAGRGTDIMLGGNPFTEEEHERVIKAGGLAIIGTERHESRRIDNQLRGRSGRQGDPGTSRFYLSLEDNLLRLFGSEKIQPFMNRLGLKDGEAIESSMLSKIIENSQKKVEELHFDIRRQLLAYDNVMNQQREAIYAERADIISTPDNEMPQWGWDIIKGVVNDILEKYFPEDNSQTDPERAALRLKSLTGSNIAEKISTVDNRLDMEGMRDEILDAIKLKFDSKVSELGEPAGTIIRYILLNTMDSAWREHLTGMDELRRGIGLRAIGQKDPLVEYQFESYNLFEEMMEGVKNSFSEQIFRVKIVSDETKLKREQKMTMEKREFQMSGQGEQNHEPLKKAAKVGRNDPCPCGSGKKYKYCHGRGL
ncbi:MAG: preprotein translocase subunit SecA [Synergistaceae bacterium]|nr:preprotein translocase subunit SecA [Synergistaceae bacterium]MBQ6738964.1 preprotein translocase subunit SecA [Synergistaceae bacterium]MBR0316345.1 preprotein translocase subunit SecA [Synergistaceae bacterium]